MSIAKEEEMEPIEAVLERLDIRAKEKRLDELQRRRARKQRDIDYLDDEIKAVDAQLWT